MDLNGVISLGIKSQVGSSCEAHAFLRIKTSHYFPMIGFDLMITSSSIIADTNSVSMD